MVLEEKERICWRWLCSVFLVGENHGTGNEQEEDGGSGGGRQCAHRVRVRATSITQTAGDGLTRYLKISALNTKKNKNKKRQRMR